MNSAKYFGCFVGMLTFMFGARFAGATTNVFLPVSGASFSSISDLVDTSGGTVANWDPANSHSVETSLGHATGGTNGFTFYGRLTSPTSVTCWVLAWDANTGVEYQYAGTWTSGNSLFIQTTPPGGGDYFYTAMCDLPAGLPPFNYPVAFIQAVIPDH